MTTAADDGLVNNDLTDTELQAQHRGCVYLNLPTERFCLFEQWYQRFPVPNQRNYYGLRALTVSAFHFVHISFRVLWLLGQYIPLRVH